MSNPFDYVQSISQSKKQLIVDEQTEKEYVPFLSNRSLSYYNDCVFFVNEMNRRHHIDKKMQFDFLCHTVRSKKRPYTKWIKSEKNQNIECIKKYFNLSYKKSNEIIDLFNEEQLKIIREKLEIGGLKR